MKVLSKSPPLLRFGDQSLVSSSVQTSSTVRFDGTYWKVEVTCIHFTKSLEHKYTRNLYKIFRNEYLFGIKHNLMICLRNLQFF